MKDFLIAFSASTAAIGGIIFAFLISKALGFEETQSDILDNVEKKILEINKINSKLLGITVFESVYKLTEKNILDKYFEELEKNYFNLENREKDYLVEFIKLNKAFYLKQDEIVEKLNEKKNEFLNNKYIVLKEIIDKSDAREVSTIDDLKKNPEFVFLKDKVEYVIRLEDYIRNKNTPKPEVRKKLNIPTINFFQNSSKFEIDYNRFNEVNTKKFEYLSPNNISNMRLLQEKSNQLLIEYKYKKEEMKPLLKKITSLKKERNSIYMFLGTAYIMVILGVIYPLSYIKYSNEAKLDYTLYNNFFSELFSFSGIMLFSLFIIFTIFTLKIYLLVAANNELKKVFNKLNNEDFLENKSYIIENFEFCENYTDKDTE